MVVKMMLLYLTFFAACRNDKSMTKEMQKKPQLQTITDTNPINSISEVPLPDGYTRINYTKGSFADWLRNIKLKKDRHVYLFNRTLKRNQLAQYAVLAVSVGHKDLQQCADAVMRLRAEYFYSFGKYDHIKFTDNNNIGYQFIRPYNRTSFNVYLDKVFSMCGSASLEKQLSKHIDLKEVMPGDVFIHGGYPGHAEIVVDCAINEKGQKIYLLAQSYMPAQDIHILLNPNYKISPWYLVNDNPKIETPEYTFSRTALKRW